VKVVNTNGTWQYVYDAFNRRVHVQTPSATTEFTYDYAGRRISSWLSPNNFGDEGRIYWDDQQFAFRATDGTTYFDHQDTLGTERMRTNYAGLQGCSYFSLPWGDDYTATVNSSGADQDNEHFALLEHDPESETEHAQFRNYASLQGRWLAPDPDLGSYDFTNPQSMNRYAYVLNNPTSSVDPSGLVSLTPSCDIFCRLGGIFQGLGRAIGIGGPSFHGSLQSRPYTFYQTVWGTPLYANLNPASFGANSLIAVAPINGIGPNPCSNANPAAINYSIYGAYDHIVADHIFPMPNKSTYSFDLCYGQPGPIQAPAKLFAIVAGYNAYTLKFGVLTGMQGQNAAISAVIPPGLQSQAPVNPGAIGYDSNNGNAPTPINTFVVRVPGCKNALTSFPGVPR
jgi:RHS repeat-associated protein